MTSTPLSELFFVEGSAPACKPTLRQKQKLAALRGRGFSFPYGMGEGKQLLKSIYAKLKLVVITRDDSDDFALRVRSGQEEGSEVRTLVHPYFWKRLGSTYEDVELDFQTYQEPQPGVKLEALSPSNARWRGGLLALDCLVFLLGHPRPGVSERVLQIFARRLRLNELTSANYSLLHLSMELTRSLGLTFFLFSTIDTKPSTVPVPPNLRPYPSFPVDYRDKSRIKNPDTYYPMRPFWGFLTESSGFERIFSCAFLVFEHYFSQIATPCPDLAMKMTGETIEGLLLTSSSLSDLEERVDAFLAYKHEVVLLQC